MDFVFYQLISHNTTDLPKNSIHQAKICDPPPSEAKVSNPISSSCETQKRRYGGATMGFLGAEWMRSDVYWRCSGSTRVLGGIEGDQISRSVGLQRATLPAYGLTPYSVSIKGADDSRSNCKGFHIQEKRLAKTNKDQQRPITTKKKQDKVKLQSRSDLSSEQKKDQLELQSWSDLPAELLERVFSPLTLIENVRASAVCKWWNTIAVSTRMVNQPPWLMFFPKRGDIYEFYDPYTRNLYTVELKELSHHKVCCSKNGWLLVCGPRRSVAFFNPLTREMIKLPSLPMICKVVAFSCAPTDPSYVIFAIRHISPSAVTIITWHPGAKFWSVDNYQNELPFGGSIWNKWVFSSGLFYCVTVRGWLWVFNPKERTRDVLVVSPPRCMDNFYDERWWEGRFLAEHNGELLIVYTCCTQNPIILKLDRSALEWERVEFLDDVTLFAGFLSTHTRTDLPGRMRNHIFFSKVRFYGKHCISYSPRDQRYYPRKQCHDWGDEEQYDNVWIDQPHDPSAFIEGC